MSHASEASRVRPEDDHTWNKGGHSVQSTSLSENGLLSVDDRVHAVAVAITIVEALKGLKLPVRREALDQVRRLLGEGS